MTCCLENMKAIILVLVAASVACVVAVGLPPQRCPPGKHYDECGTACPLTCDNYNNPPMCTEQCVPGCFCKSGQVLNNQKQCVNPKDCPKRYKRQTTNTCTKPHQHYEQCGTACPPTCDNPKPQVCTLQCVSGCFCDKGFVKDKRGNCIGLGQCPKSGY